MTDSPASTLSTPFPALKATATSTSARRAASDLENFASSLQNPRNWQPRKKWTIALTVALTGLVSTFGSSIAVPGIHAVRDEFGVPTEKVGILITTAYVLGLGCGPFLFAPISELYGRQTAYLTSLVPYFFFSLGSALSPNMAALVALRFLAGVFGSSGPALGVATMADLFAPSERGKPISIYAVGPMAGPVLGSMVGYWILASGWRWLFWTHTILAGVNLCLYVSLTTETYAPAIEKKLRYQVRHPIYDPPSFISRFDPRRIIHDLGWMRAMVSVKDVGEVFGKAFSRPPRLLFTNPVCLIFSLYYAYIYAIIYMCLVGIPLLYGRAPFARPGLFSYNWPQNTISLSYVGLAIGFMISATTAANAQDRIYRYLSKRAGDSGQPEYRLVLTQIGMFIMPIGLLIFGWTAHAEVHWIGPQFGLALVALGLMLPFNSIQNFLVDAFFPYSATAVAGATALRSITACILPEFTGDMFHDLGWGWGSTLLACVALVAVPAPAIMFKYGRSLRERFQFDG